MDKWKILSKNLEDTGVVDERERFIASRETYIGFTVMMIAWAAIFFFNFFTGQPTSGISFIAFSGLAGMRVYRAVMDFSKTNLGFAIFATLAALGFATAYVVEILGA